MAGRHPRYQRDGYSLVLTAVHCAYDEAAGFATNWLFIPDYESAPTRSCADTKDGCWTYEALVVHNGWAKEAALTQPSSTTSRSPWWAPAATAEWIPSWTRQ